jgi:hypothetical protein
LSFIVIKSFLFTNDICSIEKGDLLKQVTA